MKAKKSPVPPKGRTVQVTSDTSSVLRLLSKTFTSGLMFIPELLQNARRAGATQIDITATGDEFTIVDNGCGIDDFSTLLALARSGWSEDVQRNDSPYGAGWFSVAFAGASVSITSRGTHLSATTEALLSLQMLALTSVPLTPGTTMSLYGHGRDVNQIEAEVIRRVAGLPVSVTFNGKTLARPSAIDQRNDWMQVPDVGLVSADVLIHGGWPATFLQGLPIFAGGNARSDLWNHDAGVLHLDPTLYFGRMPDRDSLIDRTEAHDRIRKGLDAAATVWLEARAAEMEPREFVTAHGHRCASLRLYGLLNRFDFVPGGWVTRWDGETTPDLNSDNSTGFESPKDVVSRQELQAAGVFSVDSNDDVAGECFAAFGGAFILSHHPSEDHWLHGLIKEIDYDEEFTCRLEPDLGDTQFTSPYLGASIRFGERVFLVHPTFGEVEVPQYEGVYLSQSETFYARTDTSSSVVNQACTFNDENDYYDERGQEEAAAAFSIAAKLHLASDAAEALRSFILQGLPRLIPAALKGKQFTVALDDNGKLSVAEASPNPSDPQGEPLKLYRVLLKQRRVGSEGEFARRSYAVWASDIEASAEVAKTQACTAGFEVERVILREWISQEDDE